MWPAWKMSLPYWQWHSCTHSFLPCSVITAVPGFQRHGKLLFLGLACPAASDEAMETDWQHLGCAWGCQCCQAPAPFPACLLCLGTHLEWVLVSAIAPSCPSAQEGNTNTEYCPL